MSEFTRNHSQRRMSGLIQTKRKSGVESIFTQKLLINLTNGK